jgi:cytochrome P450 family 4
MFFTTLFLFLAITFVSWYQIKYGRRNKLLAKIPSPKKKLFFHNCLDFVGVDPKKAFEYFAAQSKKLGKIFHVTMTPFDGGFAIINDVKVAEAILSSQTILDKTIDYELFKPWIGTGLIIASGNKWFKRRKLLTPGFHFQILERFAEIMNEQAKVFVQQLNKHVGGQVDFFPKVNLFALDTVCGNALIINYKNSYLNAFIFRELRMCMRSKSASSNQRLGVREGGERVSFFKKKFLIKLI